MSYQLNISDIGLRLIKVYEGYAENGQTIRGGRRLVGYGRVTGDRNLQLSKAEADALLMSDLAEIENIVNSNIHAAMSQSQFDALCSLAYSIGADAFLNSDVLHAMNRGEIIKAANGFDGWRLGNIDGHIYVVDALVRRRTAEKALFLRSARTIPAPHEALKAIRDTNQTQENVARTHQNHGATAETTSNIVPLYETSDPIVDTPIDDLGDTAHEAEIFELNNQVDTQSPIAEAAAEVSERLDALMDPADTMKETSMREWPESLVDTEEEVFDPAEFASIDRDDVDFEHNGHVQEDIIIGDTVTIEDDGRYASADKFIEQTPNTHSKQNFWAFVTMIILGLTMAGAGLWARMTGNLYFGDLSRLTWSATFALGFLLLVMGVYYLTKQIFGKS